MTLEAYLRMTIVYLIHRKTRLIAGKRLPEVHECLHKKVRALLTTPHERWPLILRQ